VDDERKRIEAFIESVRQETERLGKELDATRKLAKRSEDRRIDNLLRRRRKPRRDDEPKGRLRRI
jgi:hypothetical protein